MNDVRDKAIATVKATFPDAYHTGHGTINQIVSHNNHRRAKAGVPNEEPVKILSNNLVISASFDQETIEYLDTALWVQAAAIVERLPKYDLTKYL